MKAATPFRVGLVVIAGVVALLYMVSQVREGVGEAADGYRVYAIFDDVTGLAKKSRVVIAGIPSGEIDRIELDGSRARVWIYMTEPLRSDATVARRQASLLGEYYLQLTPGALGEPLKDGDQITRILTDTSPREILNQMRGIIDNVEEITGSVRDVVSGEKGERRLVEIMENVNRTVSEINRTVAANGPKVDIVVDNVVSTSREAKVFAREFRRDANLLLTDARAIVAQVRSIVGEREGDLREGFEGLNGAIVKLDRALDQLEGTLAQTREIGEKINRGDGTLGRLVNDDKLINEAETVLEETGGFIKQITRLQTIIALRSDYFVDGGQVKNTFSLRLQPRPDKYYLLQLIDDPRGRIQYRETVTNTTDSDSDPLVREQETITEDRFRLSLQYAQRFAFLTGRIGLVESSGGIGLDARFFDDRLEFVTDLFDFNNDVSPRFRAFGTYQFFMGLYVAGGVDDVLNDDFRDFFFGAGIRFNDEDLKALFTTAPTPSF